MEFVVFILFAIVLFMLASAGIAAFLAIKVRHASRRRRTVWASTSCGALLALTLLGFALADPGDEGWQGAAAMALLFAVGTVVALPAAVAMSRLAERPPPVGDTFD
jgi:hypothetical protein